MDEAAVLGRRAATPKKDDPPGGDVRAGLGNDTGWMSPRTERVHECPKRPLAGGGSSFEEAPRINSVDQ